MKSRTHRDGTRLPPGRAAPRPRTQRAETKPTRAPAPKQIELLYSRLFRTAQAGILILNARTGRIEHANSYLIDLLGYSRAEIVEKKLWEVAAFKDTKAGKDALKALRGHASFRFAHLGFRTKDGRLIPLEFASSHVFVSGAEVIKCNVREITAATEADQRLIPSDDHFRALFENMLEGYAHCRMIHENGRPSDFTYLHVNQAFGSITGLKDVVGRRVTEVIPGIQNTNPELFEAYGRVADTGKPESLETYVEGLKTWFSVSAYSPQKGEFVAVFENITTRKGAQDALRESEAKYRGLVTEISDGIFVTDERGTLTFANPALARILGVEGPHQLLGRNFIEFVTPSASKTIAAYFRQAIETGRSREMVTVDIVRPDGTDAVVEIRSLPLMAGGKAVGTRGVLRDITERTRVEQALEESEAHLRGLFEDSPISLWEQDFSLVKQRLDSLREDGVTDLEAYFEEHPEVVSQCAALVRVLDVNKATLAVYGAHRKEDLLTNLEQVLSGRALQDFRNELVRIAAGEFQFHWEGRNKTLDGRSIDVDLNWSVVPGYEKSLSRVIVAAIDITERKQSEEALRAAEEKFRAIFENSIDGVFQSTLEGRFLTVNPAFARMLGYASPQDMIETVTDIARQVYVESPRRDKFVSSMAEQGSVTAFEFQMRRKDGSVLWVSENVRAVRDADGKLLYYEGTVVEVTERKQAQILQEAVYRIASAAETARSLDELYPQIHQIISSVMPADNFYITIYDAAQDMLRFPYFQDVNDEPFIGGVQPGKGLSAYVLRTGKSLLCTQAVHDELERLGEVKLLGAPSAIWLGVPLIVESKTIGAMVVQHYSDPTAFGERERHMLEFVSRQVALAIDRKQTQEARQEGERRFRDMLENAALIAIMLDARSCVTFCNDYLLQLTGHSRADVVGQNWFAMFVPPESPIGNLFAEGMQQGTIVPHFENQILTASGARRTVSWNNTVLRDAEGRVIGTASLGEDITERKQAEEVIRRRGDEFAALYETTRGLSGQYELSALLQTVAQNAAQLLKSDSATMYLYDPARDELELMVQAGIPLPLGTRLKMGEGMAGRVAQSREPLIVDDYRSWPSRSPVFDGMPMRAVAQVPMLSGGNLIGVLAVTEFGESRRKFTEADVRLLSLFAGPAASAVVNTSLYEEAQKEIVERKQAEEASRKAEEQFRSIFDNSIEEITQTTPDGRFIAANPAAVRMMGYASPEELIGGFSDLAGKFYVQPGRRQEFISIMEKDGTVAGFESEVYRRDGTTRWISENSRVVRHPDGSVAYYEGTAQDITERKQAQSLQEAVYRIAAAAEATGSLEDLYPQIHQAVSSVMPAENFYITIYDAAEDVLRFPYFRDVNDQPFVGGVQPGKGLTAYVLRTGKSLLCTQPVHDDLERRGEVILLGVPSAIWLGVPLIVEGKTIGAMVVQHYTDAKAYGEREQHMLEFVSKQVALAINRKQAEDLIRRRADEFAALYETTYGLTAEYDLSSLLQTISDNAVKLLNSSSAAMYLYDPASDELELAVKTGFPVPLGVRLKMGEGMAGRVAQSREPLIVDDYQAWQPHSSLYDGIPFRAVVEVPMLSGGNLIGVLAVTEFGESLRKFTEADTRLLSLFASPAAISIANTRLYQEAQNEIAERKRSEQKTLGHLRRLAALRSIDTAISSTFDLRVTLNFLLQQVTLELGVDAAAVLVLDRDIQELTWAADRGFRDTGITRLRLRLGQDYAGRVALERRSIYLPDIRLADPPFKGPGYSKDEGFVTYYAAPLIAKGQVKGVLEVFHRSSLDPDSDWTDFLETLAAQTAIAMDNDELFGDLQQSNAEMLMAYDRTIEGWSRAMDMRDKETEGHTLRVTAMTLELARAMQTKESELPHIRRGALLHDIGKLAVPDSILLKPDKLTAEEWVIMRQHPTHAYEMLSPIAYLRAAIDIPYCHHEKWDGAGYPRGLRGEEIPLDARIFAVVDVWDALTSDRPYRAAWSQERALEYIKSESGKQFDPQVVTVFLKSGIADGQARDSSS